MLTLTLFSSAVLATSVSDLPLLLSNTRIDVPSARDVASHFASIRHGSFTSVSDFRRGYPLQKFLVERPELFRTAQSEDPIQQLATDLGVSRLEAVTNFIAHNYHQIDTALAKILRSTNDAVVAAILIDPIGATDAALLEPITELIVDYLRVRRRRCLLDHLPYVFADPIVYDKYFTPIEGYRVNPKEELGYTAVLPDDPMAQLIDDHGGVWRHDAENGVIWIHVESNAKPSRDTLIDVRRGCAVIVKSPFEFLGFTGMVKWLSLLSQEGVSVWREDSVEPLILPARHLRPFADKSFLVASDGLYFLPADLSVTFRAMSVDEPPSEYLFVPSKRRDELLVMGDGGVVAIVSNRGLTNARRLTMFLRDTLSRELKCSMGHLEERLGDVGMEVRSVLLLVNRLYVRSPLDVWLMSMELCARFRLSSRDALVQFIVGIVYGNRPSGVESLLPVRFISHMDRLRDDGLAGVVTE